MKTLTLLLILAGCICGISCSKTGEAAIDCVAEGVLVSLKYQADNTDAKKINFTVQYDGDKTVMSVEWQFGDGSKETSNVTTTHIYAAPGPYTVKAFVHLSAGSSTCVIEPSKNITVN